MITDKIIKENAYNLKKIQYSPDDQERKEILKDIIQDVPLSIIKKLEQEKQMMKKFIQKKNPEIQNVEVVPDYNNLKYWNEVEKVKVLEKIDLDQVSDFV